ncbi:hypothetical protein ACFPM3_02730 [Streptomyces coeruleoprunus]|uniref:Uncharacterized protein n=1 Tax=Streptomyces coeruleoprunus TaxID=285563 RepID=A0ABV9XA03_9ACTN
MPHLEAVLPCPEAATTYAKGAPPRPTVAAAYLEAAPQRPEAATITPMTAAAVICPVEKEVP